VTPSPLNPLGVKGIGEGGTIAAPPAVVNAVVDALEPLGIDHLDMPLTPETVWTAIREARGDEAAVDAESGGPARGSDARSTRDGGTGAGADTSAGEGGA
jgi:carbon-monoxide dehydrogenase large subunit